MEVRSLNGKNLDLSVRMPSVLKEKEMELRKQLGARIVRGKSDVAIHFEADAAGAPRTQWPRHREMEALRTWQKPATGLLSTAVQFPDAMQTSREAFDHEAWKGIHAWWWKQPTNSTPSETLKAPHCADFSARWTPSMPWRRWARCWTRLKRVRTHPHQFGRDRGPRGPRRGPVRAGGAVLH